jgi:phenylalanyl-tRNA synthetase beta subunit
MRLSDISAVHLQNTLSPELAYMRSSLIPSIQNVVTENAKRFDSFSVFEINPVIVPQDTALPQEPVLFTFASYTKTKQPNEVIQRAKSIWLRLLDELQIDSALRKLLPIEIETGDILGYSFGYEIDIEALLQEKQKRTYKQIPVSPPTKQDISFFLAADQVIGPVVELIHHHAGPYLKTIELLDIYQSQEMQKQEQKSVTVRLIFEDPSRSIPDSEINPIRLEIEKLLSQEFGAAIR